MFMIDVHMVGQMDNSIDHTFDMANRVYGADGIAPTLHTCGGGMTHTKVLVAEMTKEIIRYDDYNATVSDEQDISGTITTQIVHELQHATKLIERSNEMAEEKQVYRIRKLTPKECFRLMGVRDEDYDKLTVSDTQKYKQAGNSIVVDVLEEIFMNLFVRECKKNRLF